MRLVAAALCGMATAAHTSVNIERGPGEAAQAGHALAKAMGALEEAAKDVHRHRRTISELMGMGLTSPTRRRSQIENQTSALRLFPGRCRVWSTLMDNAFELRQP
jgi:hypothetical protein